MSNPCHGPYPALVIGGLEKIAYRSCGHLLRKLSIVGLDRPCVCRWFLAVARQYEAFQLSKGTPVDDMFDFTELEPYIEGVQSEDQGPQRDLFMSPPLQVICGTGIALRRVVANLCPGEFDPAFTFRGPSCRHWSSRRHLSV